MSLSSIISGELWKSMEGKIPIIFIKYSHKYLKIFRVSSYKRTAEDVKSVIKLAKLNEKKLTNLSQAIHFETYGEVNNNFKLLELNDHLLTSINEGEILSFKGVILIILIPRTLVVSHQIILQVA